MGSESVLIVALVSTIAFFGYFLLSGFGDTDYDIPSDDSAGYSAAAWGVLQFLSIQLVLLAAMSYSWSWLFFSQRIEGTPMQVGATMVVGSAMVALYLVLVKQMKKLNSSGRLNGFTPEVGMKATVYSTIPAGAEAVGVVTFMDRQLGDVMIDATTRGNLAIPTGSSVVVTQVSARSVEVQPAT